MELTVDSWLIFKERCKREKEKHCLHIRSAKPYQQQLYDSNEKKLYVDVDNNYNYLFASELNT